MKREEEDELHRLFRTEFYEMVWIFDNTAFKVKIGHIGLFLEVL